MTTLYPLIIKSMRQEKGLLQQQVADTLGISRPSYIALENGVREPRLNEAKKLADVLGISINDLLGEETPNIEKYKQMLLAFLRNKTAKNEKVPKTKLAKLLYFADFSWYYNHSESMSGMRYRKIPYGPVPEAYFQIVNELYEEDKIDIEKTVNGAFLISQKRGGARESLDALSDEEKKRIADIAKKWEGKSTREIVNFTHQQLPYATSRDREIIPYKLIVQEDPNYVY